MQIIDCIQGSEEWLSIKCGIPSASHFSEIITTKGEPSKSAKKYLYRLAGENITGTPEETYQSEAMARGVELEDEARKYYEFLTDTKVRQVGFCIDNGVGASPDGLVGKPGLVEIKCPKLATHVEYLLENKLPTIYFCQTQGQLFVTGRKWLDFVSYFPGIKPFIIRVEPDKKFHEALKTELELFVKELESVVTKLKEE